MKLLLLISLLFPLTAIADGTVTFTWEHPTERTDNTPIPVSEIAGYKIYGNNEVVETGPVITISHDYIGRGQTEFRIQTVDTDGLVSEMSEPIYVNLSAPPKKPVNFGGRK